MELSSNVFWHQTDYNGLRGIIKDKGLFYSYSREDLRAYKGRIIGSPMGRCTILEAKDGKYEK